MHGLYPFYLAVSRWVLPALAVLVALFWIAYFRAARPPKRVIARFTDGQGTSYPVTVAEGFVGRGRRCDVALPDETVYCQSPDTAASATMPAGASDSVTGTAAAESPSRAAERMESVLPCFMKEILL